MIAHLLLLLVCPGILGNGEGAPPRTGGEDPVIALGTRRELFVDHFIIERLSGAQLRLHAPRREGVALRFDKPWEGPFSGYVTVLKDSSKFRMYYRGLPSSSPGKESAAVTCVAESRDGILWERPEVRLFEVAGSRRNNVVLAGPPEICHNFAPFIDARPDVPPSERYKGVGGDERTGLMAYVSADGVRWRQLRAEPILRKGMFDSQNIVFWSEAEGRYVCYFRTWTGPGYTGFRTISRATSPDFLTWSEPVEMGFGDTPREHLYTNATQPYVRAPHIYLALPKRFFPDRATLSAEAAEALVADPHYRASSSDAVLMSTRGGDTYDRTFMEAFIRPGTDPRDWVSRDNTPAAGIIPGNGGELFLYRGSHYAQSTSHVTRYTLRLDGFASVRAPYGGGELLTKRLTFEGCHLELNYSTSAAGSIRVEIQDTSGGPFPGYSLDRCQEIIGDEIDRRVRWDGGDDLAGIAGRVVRIRFVMADADLFSFRFRP